MAQYIVPQSEFIEIAETSGMIQNDSAVVVELSNVKEANTGIRIYPHESKSFGTMPKYVRALGNVGPGVVHVVGFMETVPDGDDGISEDNIATDSEVNEMLNDAIGGNEPNGEADGGTSEDSGDGNIATDDEVNEMLDDVLNGDEPVDDDI